MTNLKRSFFGVAFYIAIMFVLAQMDFVGRPIVNFASYFYLSVMIAVPVTLFFPSVSNISSYVPIAIWAGIYLIVLQVIDRTESTETIEFPVIVLEFLLLEIGVWFSHQLAIQISQAESIMDALAVGVFPSRVHQLDDESQRIKVEFTRSRRYHRPLSVIMFDSEIDNRSSAQTTLSSIQADLSHRFTIARTGQIIDDRIRQTDVLLRDRRGRFIVLCPETEHAEVELLASRIAKSVEERVNTRVLFGTASFPDEAITFEDMLDKCFNRLGRLQEDAPNVIESNVEKPADI